MNGLKLDRIWGTDLEIHVAASLWQVPIYVCTQNPKYFWIHFKPTERAKLVCPDECTQLPLRHSHQVCFTLNCFMLGSVIMMLALDQMAPFPSAPSNARHTGYLHFCNM